MCITARKIVRLLKLVGAQLVNYISTFTITESSLLCSQKPAICVDVTKSSLLDIPPTVHASDPCYDLLFLQLPTVWSQFPFFFFFSGLLSICLFLEINTYCMYFRVNLMIHDFSLYHVHCAVHKHHSCSSYIHSRFVQMSAVRTLWTAVYRTFGHRNGTDSRLRR